MTVFQFIILIALLFSPDFVISVQHTALLSLLKWFYCWPTDRVHP